MVVFFTCLITHKVDMGNIANERVKAANEAVKTLEARAEATAEKNQRIQNAIEKAAQNQVVINDASAFAMSSQLHTIYTPTEPKAAASCEEGKKLYRAAWQYARRVEQSCDELQTTGTKIITRGEQINLSAIQSNESE